MSVGTNFFQQCLLILCLWVTFWYFLRYFKRFQSYCILLTNDSENERLKTIEATTDGFKIAEADLKLRGAGEVLGIRQSGLPLFHFADMAEHADLLQLANQEAVHFLSEDPSLKTRAGGTFLVIQWLRLHASKAARMGSVSGWRTNTPHAVWHGKKLKKNP